MSFSSSVASSSFTNCFTGSRESCPFTCHCTDKSLCSASDWVTDQDMCVGSCDSGWSGPGCQRGVISYGKPAEDYMIIHGCRGDQEPCFNDTKHCVTKIENHGKQ